MSHTIEQFLLCVQPNVNAWAKEIQQDLSTKDYNIYRMETVLDILQEEAPEESDLILYVSNLINECEEWL